MKVAIDAVGISRPGGGRSATLNLLQPLFDLDHNNEYIVFLDEREPCLASYGNVRQVIAPTKRRLAVRAWAQAIWPRLLKREGVQVIHYSKNLTTFTSCPSVVTVHDLTVLAHPEFFPLVDVAYWHTVGRFCLRHVDRVIAVSQRTAGDVVRYCGVRPESVSIIHEGIDPIFQPAHPDEVSRVRRKYRLPGSYILHVGSIWPKKNLATLARAFVRLARSGAYDGALVLVGAPYLKSRDRALDEFLSRNDVGGIIQTGHVPVEDLPPLYSGALCFVFPSLHEGFGLVPLEAAACGAPVMASRVGALEEILGGAAVFLDDPKDDAELASRIRDLLEDESEQTRMGRMGRLRATALSRREAAERTWQLYSSMVESAEVREISR